MEQAQRALEDAKRRYLSNDSATQPPSTIDQSHYSKQDIKREPPPAKEDFGMD